MATTILADFAHQYFSDDGKPAAGYKIFFYEHGTSSVVEVFSDSSREIPWSSPLVLDSAGRIPAPGTIFPSDSPSLDIYITDADDVPVYGPYGPVATLASV